MSDNTKFAVGDLVRFRGGIRPTTKYTILNIRVISRPYKGSDQTVKIHEDSGYWYSYRFEKIEQDGPW